MLRPILAVLLVTATPVHALYAQPVTAPNTAIQPATTADSSAARFAAAFPFEESDLTPDPGFRFGVLENGMRYIIRSNATPAKRGTVQLWIDRGSIAEGPEELGYAHFIEHMAFNGSTNVPEGEMVKLLEREGLAFGADANASTSFTTTLYRLDLPRAEPKLLDTALMLMRETVSELTMAEDAVEREKGVILSERRVRDTYALRNTVDQLQFFYPNALFPNRLPIGTVQTIQNATAAKLKDLWQRLYRPENAAIIVIGDFDADVIEAHITKRFAGWVPKGEASPKPDAGPVDTEFVGATHIHVDPALSERITISRHGEWQGDTDNLAFRQTNVRRELGHAIINRRFQRLARSENPPFRGAGFGNSNVFKVGRTTNLIVDSADGDWQASLAAAQEVYRQALEYGFTQAEVDEQVTNLRSALENNLAGAHTRSNSSLLTGALTLLEDGQIPTTPASALARFEDNAPLITPDSIMEALREELIPLDNPLIRFEGRRAPEGGADALRKAWNDGMAKPLAANDDVALAAFAYTDFGPAGSVVKDGKTEQLDIRTLTFANGLRLNLKRTDLQADRIGVELHIDGGNMLNTRDKPLATALVSALPVGGLGKHSTDELQSILAGRSVNFSISGEDKTFRMGANTRPRDLELQLQLMAAAITDPGYRPQGEVQYQRNIKDFFARFTATPDNALSNNLGKIISDGDPRFTMQPEEDYLAQNFAGLRETLQDRLAKGALELSIVGDIDEEATIAMVANTLGALPPREAEFNAYTDNRIRSFTQDRSPRVIYHDGTAEQAIVRMTWPTTDDSDFTEVLKLELLERVVRQMLTETLREELGQIYSPGVNATQSGTYTGYGTFNLAASVDVAQVDAARTAILAALDKLIAEPVDEDTVLRARAPMVQEYENALTTNAGWMSVTWRAQSEPARIGRFLSGKDGLLTLTPQDVQATAAKYLKPAERLEIVVLPRPQASTD